MSRRRYISTDISLDKRVNQLARQGGDFAVMLYIMMIPHADDSGHLTGDFEELTATVLPMRRDVQEEQVEAAVMLMQSLGLVIVDADDQRISFPSESFYKYQTYIPADKRRGAINSADTKPTPKNAEERRRTPKNAAYPSPSPSPSPSLTHSTREDVAQDEGDAGECGIFGEDHYPNSGEPESDPFTPEELTPIHFPAPSHAERTSLARQQKEKREQAESLITAFAKEIGGEDAPVTAGFIKSSLSAAFSLLSAGATPQTLRCAVRVQREQWPGQKSLTLAYIEQHWPQLSRVTPSAPPPDEDSPAVRAKREREAQGRATMELYYSQREEIMARGRAMRESGEHSQPSGAVA